MLWAARREVAVDEQALIALYRKFGYLVFRRCRAVLGNHADAEDAMQEVFLRAQRYGASFENREPSLGSTPSPATAASTRSRKPAAPHLPLRVN